MSGECHLAQILDALGEREEEVGQDQMELGQATRSFGVDQSELDRCRAVPSVLWSTRLWFWAEKTRW